MGIKFGQTLYHDRSFRTEETNNPYGKFAAKLKKSSIYIMWNNLRVWVKRKQLTFSKSLAEEGCKASTRIDAGSIRSIQGKNHFIVKDYLDGKSSDEYPSLQKGAAL